MSSIRPLITITILVVVGVLLYVKINEGTLQVLPAATEAMQHPMDGIPPLAPSSVAPATSETVVPEVPGVAVEPAPNSTPAETAATTVLPAATPVGTPEVPPIPAIPQVTAATGADASPTDATTPPLPENIPEASYPNPAETVAAAAAGAAIASATTPADTTPGVSAATAETPEQMNEATVAETGLSTSPVPLDPNPLRTAADKTPVDRYGVPIAAATPTDAAAAAVTPVESTSAPADSARTFAEGWPNIQTALERGDLAEAHKLLSRWYGDPSLTPIDAERVEQLLSQLAGSVVYSTEHRLAPAHVVKQGETLETIAAEYQVPWQLLGKINGVSSPTAIQPGQELKVLRGPFSAIVDLSRKQLTLMIDDRYAGKFPIAVSPEQEIREGDWVVDKKSSESAPGRALLLQGNAGTPGAATTLVIAAESLPLTPTDGTVIKVGSQDAEELSDILSIGSRVVTRK